MRRFALLATLACGASALACSTILGLQEPTVDNTIGDGASGGDTGPSGDGGDAATGPVQLLNARTRHIALDDTSVYYTEQFDYVIGRVGKDGSGNVALVNGSALTGYFPGPIVVDATDVFWGSVGGISQCKKAGCGNSPTHLIDENADASVYYSPGGIAVDDTNVYFVDYDSNNSNNAIRYVPKGVANGTVSTLVSAAALCPTLNEMQLISGYLYFTCDEGPVGRISLPGGVVETLSGAAAPKPANSFVMVGQSLYYDQFLESASIFQMPIVADASSSPIALSQPYANGIDSDGTYLYWANLGVTLDNGGGTIARFALSQCSTTVTTIATNIDIPIDVKVDQTTIFWNAQGNGETPNTGVWKMAK